MGGKRARVWVVKARELSTRVGIGASLGLRDGTLGEFLYFAGLSLLVCRMGRTLRAPTSTGE